MANFNFIVFMLFLGSMLAMCASKCPRVRRTKTLRLNYGFQRRLIYFRCKRGFDLIGAKSAVCNGNKWSTEFPICIAPGCPPIEYDQNILDVTYTYRGSLATFQCKANYVMEDEDNRVYCNKFKWSKPPPTCIKNSLRKSCDYEDGICGWTQDWTDQFDWEIHSKETSTKFTGPSNDHTYGNSSEGHYIYVEASAPRRPGDQARVLSPLYNFQMQVVCFEFWFHMWSPLIKEVGSLQIYAIPENNTLVGLAPLLKLSGNYGKSWRRERIQINPMKSSFQIILEATRGLSHQNDIAVDDIQLYESPCDDVPNKTDPLQSVTEILKTLSSKETIATTLSIQPTLIASTINTPVYEVSTDKKLETITAQTTLTKIPVTQTSLSSETKEKRLTNTTETTDSISQRNVNSSSMASVTVAETDDQGNMSNRSIFHQSSASEENISARRSRERFENYTPLAIGLTVVTLFGIGVIFFIVWIWARSQDRKRAMAEEAEEEAQPITNSGSNCSF